MLCRVVLIFKSVDKAMYCATIQLENVEHHFFPHVKGLKKGFCLRFFLETAQCSFNFFLSNRVFGK